MGPVEGRGDDSRRDQAFRPESEGNCPLVKK